MGARRYEISLQVFNWITEYGRNFQFTKLLFVDFVLIDRRNHFR